MLIEVAKRLSITISLGNTRNGKLALWQTFARVIAQDYLDYLMRSSIYLEAFTEDDLYERLACRVSK